MFAQDEYETKSAEQYAITKLGNAVIQLDDQRKAVIVDDGNIDSSSLFLLSSLTSISDVEIRSKKVSECLYFAILAAKKAGSFDDSCTLSFFGLENDNKSNHYAKLLVKIMAPKNLLIGIRRESESSERFTGPAIEIVSLNTTDESNNLEVLEMHGHVTTELLDAVNLRAKVVGVQFDSHEEVADISPVSLKTLTNRFGRGRFDSLYLSIGRNAHQSNQGLYSFTSKKEIDSLTKRFEVVTQNAIGSRLIEICWKKKE